MDFAVFLGIILLVTTKSLAQVDPEWMEPYCLESGDDNVRFNYTKENLFIYLNENLDGSVIIAYMNYAGSTKPSATFSLGMESQLGLEFDNSGSDGKWALVVTKSQDYENINNQRYIFNLRATTDAFQYKVYLTVNDVNDNPPIITDGNLRCLIKEGPKEDYKNECEYTVSDADSISVGDHIKDITWEIIGNKNEAEIFDITIVDEITPRSMKIALTLNQDLDYEKVALYMFSLILTDGGGNSQPHAFTVEVVDIPDEPPRWVTIPTVIKIDEETVDTSYVYEAVDGDTNIRWPMQYSIDPPNVFVSIDATTGRLLIAAIDRDVDGNDMIEFTVIAIENPSSEQNPDGAKILDISDTVTIFVQDLDDNNPLIEVENVATIPENTLGALLPGIVVDDIDLGTNAMYDLRIEPANIAAAFLLVPASGYQSSEIALTIKNQNLLDYENPEWRQFELTIISEGKTPEMTDSKTITITLTNWNDEVPVFDANLPTRKSIDETVGINELILQVLATDADEPEDVVRYSLVGTSINRIFAIDEITGELTTKIVNALDYEKEQSVEIQIRATDTWENPSNSVLHTSTFSFTIDVNDVNDERPELTLPTAQLEIDENQPQGYLLTDEIEIYDVDTKPNLDVQIDWTKSRATKFGVNIQNTAIFQNMLIVEKIPIEEPNRYKVKLTINDAVNPQNTPDFEEFDVLYVYLVVTDLATQVEGKSTTTGTLMILIKDINDNAPEFDESTFETKSVTENTGLVIAKIYATDRDTLPKPNDIRFFIKPTNGTVDGLVAIDELKGEIRVTGLIDAEAGDPGTGTTFLYYTVVANDTDDEHSTEAEIRIFIVDTNDNAPYLCDGDIKLDPIEEDPAEGTLITQMKACDKDRDDPYNRVSYSFDVAKNPDVTKYFELNADDGRVIVKYAPNQNLYWHETPEITIYCIIADNVGGTGKTEFLYVNFVLKLTDINNNPPVLPELGALFTDKYENSTADTILASVTATDKDDPSLGNGKVDITILSVKQDGLPLPNIFKSVPAAGEENTVNILSAVPLKGYHGSFDIELKAEDQGTPPTQPHIKSYRANIGKYNFEVPTFIFPKDDTTVRLVMGAAVGDILYQTDGNQLPLISATDNQGEKWDIEYSIVPESDPDGNFQIINNVNGPQNARLAKQKEFNEDIIYKIQIKADDGGEPDLGGTLTTMNIRFLDQTSEPYFVDNQWTTSFTEEEGGMDENPNCFIPAVYDDGTGGEEVFPIYYYLHPDSMAFNDIFEVMHTNSCINLLEPIDADIEDNDVFEIKIVATRSDLGITIIPTARNTLIATIQIIDVNDNPPMFSSQLFSGGISDNDDIGKRITAVLATDPDKTDILRYSYVPGSLELHGNGLENLPTQADPFIIDGQNGTIGLNFVVRNSMDGYVSFQVQASDGEEAHNQRTFVNIYIISDAKNRITFVFLNDITLVETQENSIKKVFKDILGFTCNIDSIRKSETDTGTVANETDCITHFINEESKEPIDRDIILGKGNDIEIRTQLQKELYQYELILKAFDSEVTTPENIEEILTIALIVVAVVLSTFIIILIVAFIVRTRTLQQRLDKLSITQYGSQESGINRIGLSVPTTNKHALEGSNPVYNNNEITTTAYDDTMSVGSGDSDLIGVEDNPEFDIPERRASFNPIMQEQFKKQNGSLEF